MQPQLGAVLGMLIALSWTDLAAQEESSTCSLLTAADINAAVGAKVGEPHRTDMGVAPGAASKTNGNCMWKVGDQGMVSVGVMPAAKGAEAGECGVFYFGKGQGGSIDENAARWGSQFEGGGAPKTSVETIAGFKVHRVRTAGTYLAPGGPMITYHGRS